MDDDDADYMQGSEDEDYGFDYSDDPGDETGSADVENLYYTAKSKKEDNPEQALKEFRAIVDQEQEKGDWGFKALKQSTKLLFLVLHRPAEAIKTYTELLGYTKSAVTRNYAEKTINSILDYVGGGKSGPVEVNVLERFYEATKAALAEAKNDRLSAKTNLKLAKLWLDRKEYNRLSKILKELYTSTIGESGEDQAQKGTQLLEIYALEIQMHNERKNYKKLKEIYNASNAVRSAIPHPRILGVIKECGGKMWMGERQWNRASEDFFDSFKNYDEAGSPQRIQVLKYLVLANMLTGSEVNPFDSQETKPYKNDPQIKAMTDLVDAYQRREVHAAEKILRDNKATIMDDSFIKSYIGELLRSLRTQYLIDLIKPYTRLELAFLSKQLNVDTDEVEELLIGLILEGKIEGRIDQVAMRLELESQHSLQRKRYSALDKWTAALESIHTTVIGKNHSGARGDYGFGMGDGFGSGSDRW
ncbi:PCI-domain-containing protein [Dichomitus squalens]|uniref:COP9 signalosome complex subunit 2 n=1 Tax=Dichomitus squalens TaxID=114155 RepID=A0A4Q9P6E5_9APHY|nr:PCI-domain-containing protein [Dichomitus squalens LYAD-421 SS1]EJF67104.1 PCI-domain-containing protein [Dichomitus squalens LYAD-421 SS1]TBU34446.1 PCI-domain-containing protein [Dichomitus squalens]TBU50050.1 PCI-domain-containing protein [Dichomitus squalens]TBU62113.1 PCI-domain-containing protein [Dichomitus squalens]